MRLLLPLRFDLVKRGRVSTMPPPSHLPVAATFMSLHPLYHSAGVILFAAAIAGCTAEAQQYIRFPRLFSPGSAGHQRAEAIRHDPYPLPDVGPEVEGGRPREYQQPVPEPRRALLSSPRPVPAGPLVPAPTLPAAPAPVITAPYPPAMSSPPQALPVQPRSPY
jgi:hypothetical protein